MACQECAADCVECIDSVFTLKESFVRGVSKDSYCLRCLENPKSEEVVYINLTNGACLNGCAEPGYQYKEASPYHMKGMYCFRCQERCRFCNISRTEQCVECFGSYYLTEHGICLSFFERQEVKFGMAFVVFGVFAVGILCCSIWIIALSSGRSKELAERIAKKKEDREEMVELSGQDGQNSEKKVQISFFLTFFRKNFKTVLRSKFSRKGMMGSR